MKKEILIGLVAAACVLIIISFFMPWAKIATSVTGVSKEVTSKLKGTPFAGKFLKEIDKATTAIGEVGDISIKMSVSGFNVPNMVNSKTSKVAISLMEILTKSNKNLELKSYAVYLLPLFGLICVALSLVGSKNKIAVIAMLVLSGAIGVVGLYNLSTIDVSSIAVKVTIEKGLWYTMYSFLFIFFVSIAWLVVDRKS